MEILKRLNKVQASASIGKGTNSYPEVYAKDSGILLKVHPNSSGISLSSDYYISSYKPNKKDYDLESIEKDVEKISKEILKEMDKFDAKVKSIMSKYGYKKN